MLIQKLNKIGLKFKNLFLENRGIKRTIFKNTFWLAVAEIIQKGIGFLIIVWLARYFGPSTYGQWAFALSFVMLFSVFADFGFSTLTVREIARDKSKTAQYIDNIVAMKLILGLVTLGLMALVIQFLVKELEVVKLVCFLGIYTVINTFVTFFQSIFRANEKMQYETACRGIQSLSLLGLVVFFILNKGSIIAISYAYIAAALIGILFSLIFIWRYFSKFFLKIDLKLCKEILKEAWPFALSSIAIIIYYRIDTVMLGLFKENEVVGWYNAAYGLIAILIFIPGIINITIFPSMSRFHISSQNSLRLMCEKYLKFMLVIVIPIGVGTTLLADRIILLIFGMGYIQSIIALQILIWATVFTFANAAFVRLFESINKQIFVAKITGTAMVVNIILNLLLIPKFSYIGASVATVITEFTVVTLVFIFAYKIGYGIQNKQLGEIVSKVIIISLVMGIFIWFLKSLNLLMLVPLATLLYFGMLYMIGGIDKDDIQLLIKIKRKSYDR